MEEKTILLTCVPVNVNKLLGPNCPEYKNKHFDKVNCDKCNCLMYMGPKQKKFYDTKKCLGLCMPCTIEHTGTKGVDINYMGDFDKIIGLNR